MASKVYVRDLEILHNLEAGLGQFNHGANTVLDGVARGIKSSEEHLRSRMGYWQAELRRREDAYNACRGDDKERDCRSEAAAVREAQEALEKLRKLSVRLEQAIAEYNSPANRLRQALDGKINKAKSDLSRSVQKYQDYLAHASSYTAPSSVSPQPPAKALHYHHVYPQQFRSFFEGLGIDIDRWTVAVDETTHLKYIHRESEWNTMWQEWISKHEGEATADDTLEFGRKLLTHFGLEGLWEGDANPNPIGYDVPDDEVYRRPPSGS